jgi:eukaryotic-like serine/threonine-protein kinase
MTSEGWSPEGLRPEGLSEVERLVDEALRLPTGECASFLRAISDPAIHAEVASLLAADSARNGDLSGIHAIVGRAAQAVIHDHAAGERIGHYQIKSIIGAGGMGVVYLAEDLRLKRPVAIKFLDDSRFLSDSRSVSESSTNRITREAQAASALNHPGICTVYDVGENDGAPYLVMEFVEGATLAELIQQGPLKLNELLPIAIQIAAAVSAAHQKGIIHRDLKPANIKIKADGSVKILDFGLAKLTQPDGDRTRVTTLNGVVMGTAAYMSPEQAEGKPLETRTDIFSFGAVLYEMATGRRAFPGDSPAASMAAILMTDPVPASGVVPTVPPVPSVPVELGRIIAHCLRKDPAKRFQHMSDVKVLLEEIQEESVNLPVHTGVASRRRPATKSSVGIASLIVVIVLVAAGLWLKLSQREPGGNEAPHVIPLSTFAGSENYPSFSPDGNQVVFSWNGEKKDNWDLYVKMISGATALRLTTDAADDLFPAWSPDATHIAFLKFGERAGVYLTSPLGGPEQKVADFDAAHGAPAWLPGEKFLVAAKSYREDRFQPDAGALFLIPLQDGEPRPVLLPASGHWYQYPAFDAAGQSLAFASCQGPAYGMYCDIMRVGLNADLLPSGETQKVATVAATISGLAWSADGKSIIYSAGNLSTGLYLWNVVAESGAVPKRMEIAGQGALYPAVAARARRLAFARWMDDQDVWRLELGKAPQPLLVSSMLDASPRFSPDGSRIAFASGRGVDRIAIWLANADGSGLVQLTRGPESYHGSPRWSPDGRSIAFDARGKDGRWNIKVMEASGGEARQLTSGDFTSTAPSWSQDGKSIYFASDRTGRFEVWRVAAEGGPARRVTYNGGYVAQESADARTLYYTKTGDLQGGPLFARPSSGTSNGTTEKQLLDNVIGRAFAVFADGIYYLGSTGPRKQEIRWYDFATGHSRVVSPIEGEVGVGFSVSPDRKTFLFTRLASPGSDLMLIEGVQ